MRRHRIHTQVCLSRHLVTSLTTTAHSVARNLLPHFSCIVQVFGGAAGALAAMTVLSALMGWAAPTLVSQLLCC